MIAIEASSRVYVDTNIIIYFVELSDGNGPLARSLLGSVIERGAQLVASELTVAECLYKPAKNENSTLVAIYEDLFGSALNIEVVPLSPKVLKSAAMTGGQIGLKLLDAMHFSAAIEAECTHFLTHDRRFKSIMGVNVHYLTHAWA